MTHEELWLQHGGEVQRFSVQILVTVNLLRNLTDKYIGKLKLRIIPVQTNSTLVSNIQIGCSCNGANRGLETSIAAFFLHTIGPRFESDLTMTISNRFRCWVKTLIEHLLAVSRVLQRVVVQW